jgi:TonB family protein
MFQQFEKKAADKGSRKRTMVSVVAVVAVYVVIGVVVLYAATGEKPRKREKPLEVTFAKSAVKAQAVPEKKKPKPPAPPPVAKKMAKKRPLQAVRKRAALVAPKELPKEALPEADPAALQTASLSVEDMQERGEIAAAIEEPKKPVPRQEKPKRRARPPPPPPPPAPPPPPPPPPPIYLPEEATPPRPLLSNPIPQVPVARRKSGQGGKVILKVVITEAGELQLVKVLRGEEDLVAAVLEVLPKWRFEPALFEGSAIRVYKILEIPFRIGS